MSQTPGSGSVPRYTSKAEGFRTAEEIAAMRPVAAPKPRALRKAGNPGLRQVTNGIVCFCGERFGEAQSLEFMLHLRAEVGEHLARAERLRAYSRNYHKEHSTDPEWRKARSVRETARAAARKATDPEWAERRRAQQRESDRRHREERNARRRERRAREKAEREAADGS
jgi:hypothetical protein